MLFNKTKKILSVILALAVAVSVFTACGGDNGGEEIKDDVGMEKLTPAPGNDVKEPEGNTNPGNTAVPNDKTDPRRTNVPAPAPEQAYEKVDAENMLTVTENDGSVTYTFNALPQNAAEMQALFEYHTSTPHTTSALLMAAFARYIDSPQDGIDMLNVLRGPRELSQTEISFIKERFSDKKYLPNSYFIGATVDNEYVPDMPMTIIVYDDPVQHPDEGYFYSNVKSAGADSARRIVTRLAKDGYHYRWEYNGVMLSIREPGDPWA